MLKIVYVESLPILNGVITVGIGEMAFVKPPQKAVTYALGSCVAIVLLNERTHEGVLIHAMLPQPKDSECIDNIARYVSTSIPYALSKLKRSRGRIFAAIVGGARILRFNEDLNIGKRNVEIAKKLIHEGGAILVAEDTGGTNSRSVLFEPATATIYVSLPRLKRMRLEVMLR